MQRRAIAALVGPALIIAACSSGGGEDTSTLPEVTLFTTTTTTTTTTTAPAFEEIDEDPSTSATTSTDATPAPATTVATTTTEAPATTQPVLDDQFDLDIDGIGAAVFGADPDGIIGFISSFIGGPTLDTGYVDPFEFGVCSGTQARRVYWGSLMLEFGDASNIDAGRLHFYAYQYGAGNPDGLSPGTPEGLETPEGITYGSTVAEVLAQYPATTFLEGDDFIAPTFIVNDNLRGSLTGLSDLDTVTLITGGVPCEG